MVDFTTHLWPLSMRLGVLSGLSYLLRLLCLCPLLEGTDKLRLLNLQHNFITRVQNLSHLQCLVFLDLYDNRISEMTGISVLSSLRVLILGKNRIQRMCSLENLNQLDVLDLHGNQISRIENVSHLSELRVLNLASNNISRVDSLRGLDSLTELNLRRNCISAVTEVDQLPCLQRLFLSCNSISSFDDLGCLGESCSLSELTLDGNPVAQETWYKQATLRCLLQLRQLDMKRITEEERRMAFVLARKEEEKKKENSKQLSQKEKRRLAIRNAAQQWEGLRACLELPSSQNGAKDEVSPENSPAHSPAQTNGLTLEPSPDEPRRVSPVSAPERPTGGSENRLRSTSRPNSPRDPRLLEAGGSSVQSLSLSDSHLAELDGDTLRLFGPGALEALERGWGVQTAGAVTVITFRYIHFDAIVPTLPRIRVKFPNLAHLVFLETSLSRLPQLAALAQVRRLDQLTIHPEGNPVVSLALWRSFLIYRLHHFNLQRVNGLEVTMNDVITAERLFGTLGHIAATETPRCRLLLLLEESRKRQLQFLLDGRGRRAGLSPEELRENGRLLGEGLSRALFNYPSRDCSAESPEEGGVESSERSAVAEQYLRELVQRASDTNLKGEALHKLWPSMFTDMVRDCVLEMKDQPAFRQASLARLSQSK
ncbi:leucine-rich repeat-containing protein 49 [Osmerus mordax]|uniref:leucine-rich repeat-containing protein 49 n=1 Tax=Osmerus mordax TaxID=8014 RepID=UPI00351022C6